MTYLTSVKHNGRQELRYSPRVHFSLPLTQYCIFWKFLGQKIFFESFWFLLNWARILNINTQKWKKNFLVPQHGHYNVFFEIFWVKKIFFESFWTLLNWARILNINTKKWKKFFWCHHLTLLCRQALTQSNFFSSPRDSAASLINGNF